LSCIQLCWIAPRVAERSAQRVRPLLSAATPVYTGMSYVESWLCDAAARHPDCARMVGPAS
jgi:hypothetical protein